MELQEDEIISSPVENPKPVPGAESAKKAHNSQHSKPKSQKIKADTTSVGINKAESASEKAAVPKKRAAKVVEPRDLLPERSKRALDPAGPDRPRAKRSSEEVAAAKRKEQDVREKLIAIEKAKIVALAELEEAQKEADEEEELTRVAKWEDIQSDADAHPDGDEPDDGNGKLKVCRSQTHKPLAFTD